MNLDRLSFIRLFVLALLFVLLGSLAFSPEVPLVEAAPRATRPPKATATAQANPTPTAPANPTPTPLPTATPGGGSGYPGSWSIVSSPNVNGRSNLLNAITAVSTQDLWAVGEHRTANVSNVQTLTMHWNGASWTIVPSPNPDPNRNRLAGVAALSASDVWAVGEQGGSTGPNWSSLILHWDGSTWSTVAAPTLSPGTSELRDVAAVAANDVWAVGAASSPATDWWDQPLVLHWNGISWSSVPVPSFGTTAELNGITAVAPNDIWAVGTTLESNWKTLILHWDGAAWTRISSPNLGSFGNYLYDVEAISATDVWAVGSANNGSSTLAMRWNGSSWSIVPSPNGTARAGINRNGLNSLAAVSANNIWAVGVQAYSTIGSAGQPIYLGYALIEHWNGSAWQEVPAPALPGVGEDGELRGATASGAGAVWAAGAYYDSSFSVQAHRTLIEQYTSNP
ncbi:MAG: hypothetical protein IPM53_05765 [Anaerolineaceae bacterium]|nr:hypothetical protein [Anaerolineaceae bacterium]